MAMRLAGGWAMGYSKGVGGHPGGRVRLGVVFDGGGWYGDVELRRDRRMFGGMMRAMIVGEKVVRMLNIRLIISILEV